jgi:preprotein translocase subunit SecF
VFRIVERRYWYFLLSGLILVPGIIALILWGLPRSIDFRGGAVYTIAVAQSDKVTEAGIREVYAAAGIGDVSVVEAHDPATNALRHQIRSGEVTPEKKAAILAGLRQKYGDVEELQFDSVGPSVGAQVTRNATIAVLLAALGILIYLSVMFANVPHPVRYGVCAVIAMMHDALVVLGLAALLGHFLGWEVDALFLTALLTVLAFSVHDTIVVFDRIRENVGRLRGMHFPTVVNHSIVQTLDRSINTQLTALFALTAVFIYSQGHLQRFVFWLIVGLICGTYSSIFNAAALLVTWENRDWKYWFGRGRSATATTAG